MKKKILNSLTAIVLAAATLFPAFSAPAYALNIGGNVETPDVQTPDVENPSAETPDPSAAVDDAKDQASDQASATVDELRAKYRAKVEAADAKLEAVVTDLAANSDVSDEAVAIIQGCVDGGQEDLQAFTASIDSATTKDDLVKAKDDYIANIDEAKVEYCVSAAVAVSLQVFFLASEEEMTLAIEKVFKMLPPACITPESTLWSDATSNLETYIPNGVKTLEQVYFDDNTISTDSEMAEIEKLGLLLVQISEIDAEVAYAISSGVGVCGL